MKLTNIVIPTGVAASGMTVGQVFRECIDRQVPGIPFVDARGRLVGRVSIRNTLKQTCIPEFMVRHAHLLGDDVRCLTIPEEHARLVLDMPVDPFVMARVATITSHSPVVKALAIMEEYNTSYIFVLDGEDYRGVVTLTGVARRMLELKG
jgi:CBS-domain-containing membrane protein